MPVPVGTNFTVLPGQADRIELAMLHTYDFMIPQVGNVPIYHCRPSRPVGYATVDEWCLDIVSALGPWYLQDVREPMSPRISFRVDGAKRYLNLTRLVVLLSQRANTMVTLSPSELWKSARDIPPVKINDGNPFNCSLSNLNISGLAATTAAKFVKPSALVAPTPLSLDTPRRAAAIETQPPRINIVQASNPREYGKGDPLELDSTDPLMSAEDILLGGEKFPAQSRIVEDVKDLLR